MSAGWSKWATHRTKGEYRALRDDKGAVLCLQWDDENGPYTDKQAKSIINKQTVQGFEAGLNLLDATPRLASETQLEFSSAISTQAPSTSKGFQIKRSNPLPSASLSTPSVVEGEPTSDSRPPEEQSASVNDEIPARALQGDIDAAQNLRELAATEAPTLLSKDYQRRHSSFFTPGRVFRTLWAEPQGVADQQSDEAVYQTLRPMVVIRQLPAHCMCLPVYSNKGKGVAKPGLKPSEIKHHAILHMSKTKPQLTKAEMEMDTEPEMQDPFPVEAAPHSTLDKASRVRFDMVYTVRYNLRVRDLGRVASGHRSRLDKCWRDAMGVQ